MIQYHNTDVWTFLKLVIIIEHMKMMQMPYLTYGQCFFLGKCLHRTNSSQLFRNGLFQKKKPNQTGGRERRVEAILFFEKNPWNCFGFSLCPWKFQVKENSTPGNLVKLCTYVTSLRNFKRPKPITPFQGQKLSHEFFLVSRGYSTLFLINSWKFCLLFLEYP